MDTPTELHACSQCTQCMPSEHSYGAPSAISSGNTSGSSARGSLEEHINNTADNSTSAHTRSLLNPRALSDYSSITRDRGFAAQRAPSPYLILIRDSSWSTPTETSGAPLALAECTKRAIRAVREHTKSAPGALAECTKRAIRALCEHAESAPGAPWSATREPLEPSTSTPGVHQESRWSPPRACEERSNSTLEHSRSASREH